MLISALLADTRAGLAQAPDMVILAALRRAAAKLFRESHLWQERLDDTTTQTGVADYDLEAPTGTRIERVLWVKFDGNPLSGGARPYELSMQDADSGDPSYWSQSGQILSVWPVPARAAALSVFAVLVPTSSAMTLPDDLAEDFRSGIAALARADMMGNSPGMPYHNPAEAEAQYNFGLLEIARAKRKQMSGNWTPLRVQPRAFA